MALVGQRLRHAVLRQRLEPVMPEPQPPPPPRSAYLHVPFCRHRCGYCNFSVIAGREDLEDDFLRAIALELSNLERPRPVETLYLGGGTPTR